MSNQLQVACPKCGTRMNAMRPSSGDRASVTCPSCGHAFVFSVPKAAPAAPAPVAPAPAPTPEPDFGNFPGTPPGATAPSPLQHQPLAAQPLPSHAPARRVAAKQGSKTPMIIAASAAGLLVVGGIGTWLVMSGGKVIPDAISENLPDAIAGSVSMLDSAGAVVNASNESDQEIIRLVGEIKGETPVKELTEQLKTNNEKSRKLVYRAIRLSPISESDAEELFADLEDSDSVAEGPLTDDVRETIVEQVKTLGDQDRMVFQSLISMSSGNTSFVREYLRHGHRQLPEPNTPGEQIAVQRIEILRTFTKLMAKCAERGEAEFKDEARELEDAAQKGELPEPPSDEEVAARINHIFGPVADDVAGLAERLFEMADQRYELEKEEVGDVDQYDELAFYAAQAQQRVFRRGFLPRGEIESPFVDAVRDFSVALIDVDRAARGVMPSRIAEADQERRDAEDREKLRVAKIAEEKRQLDAKLKREAEEQNRQAAMREAASKPETPDDNQVAQNNGNTGGRPGFGGGRFPRGGPGFTGPSGMRGPSGLRGPGGGQDFSGGGNDPSAGRSRPSFGGPRGPRPQPTPIDPKTGITITMQKAGDLDSRDIMKKFAPLKSQLSIRVSNGHMTAMTSYTGPLDDVIKLIDFADVASKDDAKRQIVLEPK